MDVNATTDIQGNIVRTRHVAFRIVTRPMKEEHVKYQRMGRHRFVNAMLNKPGVLDFKDASLEVTIVNVTSHKYVG